MQIVTFGQWLKARRNALDLTQVQVAHQVGCAEITLGKIERDQRRPSKQIAELLARALQVPAGSHDSFVQFARGAGEPPVLDGPEPRATSARSQPPTNLLASLTSFIDRVNELDEVRRKLLRPDMRLLTLVGPPGIGKTRLSIQAGQTLLDEFADGVWFISLAPITDMALVLPAIARTFDLVEAGSVPLRERLHAHLRPRDVLLILDNFEQVLDAAPQVVDLLRACSKVKVLATSRELLSVYGEHGYPMPSLSLPPRDEKLKVAQLTQFDAIKLFIARAEAVQFGFALTSDNAQVIVDICLRLDGVPLAIELAVVQLRHLTLPQLRDALAQTPLQSLASSARDAEPRQRTLRSAIQWSNDLLDPAERTAFVKFGVFVGGASTEAALAVCELPDDATLHALADRNLLKRDANERWTMLEMIREFALEQLTGDEFTQVSHQHAEYFARILEAANLAVEIGSLSRVMDVEQHNARAALHWLMDRKDARAGELVSIMGSYFDHRGLQAEGRRWLHEVLSTDIELTPSIRNSLLFNASVFAWQQHDFEEALRYIHELLAVSRAMDATDSQSMLASALIALSHIYIKMGDSAQAKAAAVEALQIGRAIQDPVSIAGALNHLGEVELTLGDLDRAESCFAEAYALCQAPDWRHHVYAGLACAGMGEIALCRRDYDHALEFLREGLRRDLVAVNRLWILSVLAAVIGTKVAVSGTGHPAAGVLMGHRGAMPRRATADVCRATKLWGATEALNETMGAALAPSFRRRTDAWVAEARSRIAPEAFAAAWAKGRELSLDDAVALAMEPAQLVV